MPQIVAEFMSKLNTTEKDQLAHFHRIQEGEKWLNETNPNLHNKLDHLHNEFNQRISSLSVEAKAFINKVKAGKSLILSYFNLRFLLL